MFLVYFLAFTLLFLGIGSYFYRKKNVVKRRIETFIPNDIRNTIVVDEQEHHKKERVKLKEIFLKLSTVIRPRKNKGERLQQELDTGGIPLKPEEFILIRVVIVGLVVILTLMLHLHVLVILLSSAFAWMIPGFYLKHKKEKRLLKCASQLPQALETMSTAMKSGFSFMQAMQIIAKEVPDPIGPEFSRAIQDINLGVSMETAFETMLKRLPNKDLDIVVTALLIQRTTGGNLTQILETIKETITERVRMKEELNALTAQGKMSAWVISLLPVILGLLLNVMNPAYFSPLVSHPLGWTLLGFGAISGMVGWLLIQKIIKIEV